MNIKQKTTLSVITPIFLFFVGVGIAEKFLTGWTFKYHWYTLEKTWGVWAVLIIITGIIEYFLYRDNK